MPPSVNILAGTSPFKRKVFTAMRPFIIPSAAILISYLLGSIPFALLIGKYYGVDIRKVGSGNVGATNVTRAVGKWAGRFCFFCDFAKGALPVACCQWLPQLCGGHFDIGTPPMWLPAAAGAAAILGHIFPIFLKFKGGKGISTAAGAIFAIAPFPLLVALAVWVVVYEVSGFVSLGSIAAAVALPLVALGFARFGIGTELARHPGMLGFFFSAAALAIWRHRSNIRRLLDGTEPSFKKPKNPPPEA